MRPRRPLRKAPDHQKACGVIRRLHDDGGAIAVLTAILLPTVLLTVGALALDLGAVYATRSAQEGKAQLAAVAGARLLPDIPAARKAALAVMCSDANISTAWPAGTCTFANANDPVEWKGSRAAGTGQIAFYTEDKNNDLKFDRIPDQAGVRDTLAASDADQGVAIQVTLPEVRVDFRFAQVFKMFPGDDEGFDSQQVAETATARIGTPLGTGVFPFYVTPEEVTKAAGTKNQFCVKDPQTATTGGYPGRQGSIRGTTPNPDPDTLQQTNPDRSVEFQTLRSNGLRWGYPTNPQVVWENRDTKQIFRDDDAAYSVSGILIKFERVVAQAPTTMPAGDYDVWVQNSGATEVTRKGFFAVRGAGPDNPCLRPSAERGFLDIARADTDDDTVEDDLRENVKVGVQPTIHKINSFPSLIDLSPILTSPVLVTNLVCNSPLLIGLIQVVTVLLNPFDINCVKVDATPGFSDEVSDGLFDADQGRMLRKCSTADTVESPRNTDMDGTNLFPAANDSPLVNNFATGGPPLKTATILRTWIENHGDPVPGWIKDNIFTCPRFGLVPIVSANPGADGEYAVLGHTYIWIDDQTDGFPLVAGDDAIALQGHIIDPAWFMDSPTDGDLVSGSTLVGEWLGPDLPKEAVLVPD